MPVLSNRNRIIKKAIAKATPHNGARRFGQCFDTSESMKNAGILDVFPIFHTARLGQKIRRSLQLPPKRCCPNTVLAFSHRTPKIFAHFFFGAVDVGPQNLAVWYLFKTDAELEAASASGLCDELRERTMQNLISLGYPQEAFDPGQAGLPTEKNTFQSCLAEETPSLTGRKATVSFTTKEDIDDKA